MKKDKNTGSQLELTSLMTEYKNQFDRSNKLDNKVYITITFCGFLFVFIIGLFNGISQLVKPQDRLQLFVSVLYILSCIAVMGAYAYVLVFFMRLLQTGADCPDGPGNHAERASGGDGGRNSKTASHCTVPGNRERKSGEAAPSV